MNIFNVIKTISYRPSWMLPIRFPLTLERTNDGSSYFSKENTLYSVALITKNEAYISAVNLHTWVREIFWENLSVILL